MDMEKPSEPDSTTLEKDVGQEFGKGDDVLLNKEGVFYLGTVVQVDAIYKKYLVEFLDSTKTWCFFKDLKSFSPQVNKACNKCKKSQSESDNEILVCECGKAYHQLCHQPNILNAATKWRCKSCEEKLSPKKISPSKKVVSSNTSPTSLNKLPYNLDSLTWDSKHQVNREGRYCYCGKNGNWRDNMLQCRRCRQWFHVKCSTSVSYPILRGDKFFKFTCSICNRGKEKYKRLAMKWPDLDNLILYNLKLKEETKDYDVENTILTFVKKHRDDIIPPPELSKASPEDILLKYLYKKDSILSEAESKPLQNGDINSSETGCRVTEPQKSEHKTVPSYVHNVPKPYSTTPGDRDRDVTKNLNTSHTTDSKVISSSEYLGRGLVKRSTPFPDQSNKRDKRFRSHAVRKASRLLNKNMKRKQKTDETSVLESNFAIGESADDDDDEDDEDDDDDEDDEDEEDEEEEEEEDDEDEDTSKYSESEDFLEDGKRKMSLRTRVTNTEVRKRPQRNLLEARLNSTESKLYNPFTPVNTSKTKKNKNVVPEPKRPEPVPVPKKSKSMKPKIEKISKSAKPKLVQKTIFDVFNIKSSKGKVELIPVVRKYKLKDDQSSGDSKSNSNSVKSDKNRKRRHSIGSGIHIESDACVDTSDDEASSRGTLEPFIPTTKDFEGQNHPFRTVTDLLSTAAGVAPSTVPPITLTLPLKTVIPYTDPPRPKKRQLSEEDIIIDRNGQVKRRRRQRKNRLIERALVSGTASKTAQIVPGKNNCVDYALSKRQLRARESMKLTDKPIPPSTKTTPVKQSPTKDSNPVAEDLESSVKYFFGPAGRIANGEKYQVVAKRITPDGRLQCVVDWRGIPT